MKSADVDPDIKKECENQLKYLQNSCKVLKQKLTESSGLHKEDNLNIMQENIALIK